MFHRCTAALFLVLATHGSSFAQEFVVTVRLVEYAEPKVDDGKLPKHAEVIVSLSKATKSGERFDSKVIVGDRTFEIDGLIRETRPGEVLLRVGASFHGGEFANPMQPLSIEGVESSVTVKIGEDAVLGGSRGKIRREFRVSVTKAK